MKKNDQLNFLPKVTVLPFFTSTFFCLKSSAVVASALLSLKVFSAYFNIKDVFPTVESPIRRIFHFSSVVISQLVLKMMFYVQMIKKAEMCNIGVIFKNNISLCTQMFIVFYFESLFCSKLIGFFCYLQGKK